MTTTETMPKFSEAYRKVRELIHELGGTEEGKGIGRGYQWTFRLHGKTLVVPVPDRKVTVLDDLYVAKVPVPKTWDQAANEIDPEHLKPDAFWRLVKLFN